MGTITMSLNTWWQIIICFGTIATGIVYIVFSITVIVIQLKNKLTEAENDQKEENKPEPKPEAPNQV